MDMHLLNGLGFEFDNDESIDINAVIRCLSAQEEDPLFDDSPLYNYEDYCEDF